MAAPEGARRSPFELIRALDLASTVDVEGMAARKSAYACAHLGTRALAIGSLLGLLEEGRGLCPPRTGHLGNWSEIASGRAGPMDFNQAICSRGLGYPLIYGFTQTETATGSEGDWAYLPGSVFRRGEREMLSLYTWDRGGFTLRSRDRPLFCPFVQTAVGGSLVPLTELHWRGMSAIEDYRFELEASVIVRRETEARAMLEHLLEEASFDPNPRRAYQDLISHEVTLDGRMRRCELQRDGSGYRLGDWRIGSARELVDWAMVPFRAVDRPREFFAGIGEHPPVLPVVSSLLVGVWSAAFATHYPEAGRATGAERPTRPFNAHLHWGARAMAGFPPFRNGYFTERSTTRSMRRICASLTAAFGEFDPLCMVLLPAAIFMLCPGSAHPRDAQLLSALFSDVMRDAPERGDPQAEVLASQVEAVSREWLRRSADELSPYFRARFRERSGIWQTETAIPASVPIEPEGFRALSVRQACMIVGALSAALAGGQPA